MSIASEITRITGNISDAYTAAQAKGATMPATQNSDNLSTTIGSIPSGGVDTRGWVPKSIDANGKLVGGNTNINFTGITDVGDYALYCAFYQDTNLTGALDMSALTSVSGNSAFYQTYSGCSGITTVNLSNLTTVSGTNAFNYTFENSSITSLDLSSLDSVSGSYAFRNAFFSSSLANVNISNLRSVTGENSFASAFGNTRIQVIEFSKLSVLTGYSVFNNAFISCSQLKLVAFPALTASSFGSNRGQFTNMLRNVTGCTVVFPSAIQSVIGSWSDVTSGFGGTNTRVIFGEVKLVSVSGIPQGYTVYMNENNITSESFAIVNIGNNVVSGIDSLGRAFSYTFVVDQNTTSFTLDVSGLVFNEFLITSSESGVSFNAKASVAGVDYTLTVDQYNKIYVTSGMTITVDGTKAGSVCLGQIVSSDSSATITIVVAGSPSAIYDASNILNSISGDTQYVTADTDNDLIKFGSASYIDHGSVQITLVPPEGTSYMRIITEAYSQTENNYDYSFISLGSQRVTPSGTDIKNRVISNGKYLFVQTGINTQFVPIDTNTLDQTNLVLSIGMGEDSSIGGDNTLRIKPIKVYYW